MHNNLILFESAAVGAALQEALWWYNLRWHLSKKKYQCLLRSPIYWLVTFAFILVTGLAAVFWYGDQIGIPAKDVLLLGAAMPLLLKQAIKPLTPEQHLGAIDRITTWDYLS